MLIETVEIIFYAIVGLYVITTFSIYMIIYLEKKSRDNESEETIKEIEYIREIKIIESDLRGIGYDDDDDEIVIQDGMDRSEIIRTCKILGLNEEDYLINNGSDLIDFIDNMKIRRIRVLYSRRKYEEVSKLLKLRIRINPDELESRVLLIKTRYSKKEYGECIKECEKLLILEESNIDGHRYLARCLRIYGDLEESIKHYDIIIKNNPGDLEATIAKIRQCINLEKYEEGLEICADILTRYPENRRVLIYNARIFGRTRQYENAIEIWNMILEIDNDIEALLGLGRTYYSLGDDYKAEEYLVRALTINPGDSRVKRSLGNTYTRAGKFEDALELINQECLFNPEEISLWERKIIITLRIDGRSSIEEILEEIIRANGGTLEGYKIATILSTEFGYTDMENRMKKNLDKNVDPLFLVNMAREYKKRDNLTKYWQILKEAEWLGAIDEEEFNNEMGVLYEILNKLDINEVEIKDSIGNSDVYISEFVIKKIYEISLNKPVNKEWSGNSSVAMVSSSLGKGGAERQVYYCLKQLVKGKEWRKVSLLCNKFDTTGGKFGTYEEDVVKLGIELEEMTEYIRQEDEAPIDTDYNDVIEFLPERMLKVIRPLHFNFKKLEPTIVHSWQDGMNIDATIAALIAGVPRIVLFARSMRPDKKTALHIRGRRYMRNGYKTILKCKNVILAHNSYRGSESYCEWLEIKDNQFPVIHNGVDFDLIKKQTNREEIEALMDYHGIEEGEEIIGSVFRIVEEKRPWLWIDVAIEVLSQRSRCHFIIVGGGMLLDTIRKYIEERGFEDRIHAVGQTDYVHSWLEKMDLFLLTSKVEGLPNVIIEAQGSGIPVISTDAGGSKETIIDGVTGKIVKEENIADISNLIIETIDDKKWINRAKLESKKNAYNKFSVENMYDKMLEIYEITRIK